MAYYLDRDNGNNVQKTPITISNGNIDANKVIQTDVDGYLHESITTPNLITHVQIATAQISQNLREIEQNDHILELYSLVDNLQQQIDGL